MTEQYILHKWIPLILSANIKRMNDFCLYAEHHSHLDGEDNTCLPMSLNLASKLLLDKIDIKFSNISIKEYKFSVKHTISDVRDLSVMLSTEQIISQYKYLLINTASEEINKLLKGAQGINIHQLIKEIKFENDGRYFLYTMICDFKIYGHRFDKLKRIL
jgi:hypothetical protein